ncbi:YihY/virulence factor BrkB family protein [Actinotalea sp. K2]|uniref:YihY/virulence factor BrkB family protein n=1 Tax=Actinotalea sp. K2 TaxID=2939438 RepID=UPI0020181E68|nr:YihY/virulence factor BrkB family protein [Actinotalea sp. K2]MCL3862470.1 YihY/virulence factor BrkB family protein [Actinotalea sp. K2]
MPRSQPTRATGPSGLRRSVVSAVRAPDRFDRLEALAERHPWTVGRYNLPLVTVRGWRRVIDVRVTGLAAEMTYYAMISLIPLVTALGAALGYLERLVGAEQVQDIESTLVNALAEIFDQQVTADVLAPLVEGLLREERGGVAVSSLAVALWLASRMFRAAIRALDDAYTVPERRGLVSQWALGLGLALGAVLTSVVLLTLVVVGPLLGGGRVLAERLGQSQTFETVWGVARWPAVGLVCVAFLVVLYRYGPNVSNTWRDCLPGALLSTVSLVAVSVGFRAYLDAAGPTAPQVGQAGEAVTVAAQTIGVILAGVLWAWLSSIVVLTGGVVNAELQRERARTAPSR